MPTLELKDIETKVREVLSETLSIDKDSITPEKKLFDDLGIDSFKFVELMFALEDQINIDIPDSDLVNLKTVQDVTTYIYTRLSPKAS